MRVHCGQGCYLGVVLALVTLVMGASGQCVANQIQVTEPQGEPTVETEEINTAELTLGMFEFLNLIRNELWHNISNKTIVTKAGDPACAFIGRGVELERVKLLPKEWELPILTDIVKLQEKY